MAIHDKNRRWKGKCPKRKDSSEHLLLYLKKKKKIKKHSRQNKSVTNLFTGHYYSFLTICTKPQQSFAIDFTNMRKSIV